MRDGDSEKMAWRWVVGARAERNKAKRGCKRINKGPGKNDGHLLVRKKEEKKR
jgi:hypothetical protein